MLCLISAAEHGEIAMMARITMSRTGSITPSSASKNLSHDDLHADARGLGIYPFGGG
jgi:hypothetical protein